MASDRAAKNSTSHGHRRLRRIPIPVPTGRCTFGTRLVAQYAVADPAGCFLGAVNLSNAMRLGVGK